MDTKRLEKLQKSLAAHPADAFTRYLVALEFVKLNRPEEALAHFHQLHSEHAAYVPTYYQYAQLLESLGRRAEAIAVYREGVGVARQVGDGHAASELQAALDLLE
ncbi:tetratricopeptide repeat protein [candidate division KSB1 bacterium]|nr:tetratricopeptide repeat protein [candidate division KSB1 bacterium]